MTTQRYRPLFLTGTARSGTTLLARMLSAHPQAMVASDPYFWYFRAYRNDAMASCGGSARAFFDPTSPFQDYYFSPERLAVMDALQQAPLDVPVNLEEWDALFARREDRMRHECPDLVPLLPRMRAPNHKALLDQGLALIAEGRKAWDRAWVGFKDVWIIEFFSALARAYPEAKFVVITRDIRGVAASMLTLADKDPTQRAHVLSYARHWRKYAAFISHYQTLPLFQDRLLCLGFEDLTRHPERSCRELCRFLGLNYDPIMLVADAYVDYHTGGKWLGNSSTAPGIGAVTDRFCDRWRSDLPLPALNMLDFLCGAEMPLFGYAPVTNFTRMQDYITLLEGFLDMDAAPCSWRSDFAEPAKDIGCELFRRRLLCQPQEVEPETAVVRQCFLFEEAYRDIARHESERRN